MFAIACLAGCGRLAFDEQDPRSDSGMTGQGSGDGGGSTSDGGTSNFGSTQVGISTQNSGTDRVWMSKFTLPESAMLQQLVVYCAANSQTSTVRGIVYADAAGTPTTLLGSSSVVNVSSTQSSWVPLPFAAPVTLAPGTYWIGTQTSNAIKISYQSATGASRFNSDLFADGADTTYAGGATTYTMELSIYGEYTR